MKSIKQRRHHKLIHRTKKRGRHHKLIHRTKKRGRHHKLIPRTKKRRLDKNVNEALLRHSLAQLDLLAKGPNESKGFLNDILKTYSLSKAFEFKRSDKDNFLTIKGVSLEVYPHIHIYRNGAISFHPAPHGVGDIEFMFDSDTALIIPQILKTITLIKNSNYRPLWLQLYRALLKYYRPSNLSRSALELKALLTADITNKNVQVEEEEPEYMNPDITSQIIIQQAQSKIEELELLKINGNKKLKNDCDKRIGLIRNAIDQLADEEGILIPSPASEPELKLSSELKLSPEFKLSPEYISQTPSPLRLSDLAVSSGPGSAQEESQKPAPAPEESIFEEVEAQEESQKPSPEHLRMCHDINDTECIQPESSTRGPILSLLNQRPQRPGTLLGLLQSSGVKYIPVDNEDEYTDLIKQIVREDKNGALYLAVILSQFIHTTITKDKEILKKLLKSVKAENILKMSPSISYEELDKVVKFYNINKNTIENIPEVNTPITYFVNTYPLELSTIYIYNTIVRFLKAILNIFEDVKSEFYLFIINHISYLDLDESDKLRYDNVNISQVYIASLIISLITEDEIAEDETKI